MPYGFKDLMQDVCNQCLEDAYKNELEIDPMCAETLNHKQILLLEQKISALTAEYKSILFLYYCYSFTAEDIKAILGIDNAMGKLRYIHKMLSCCMGLKNALIDTNSMKSACNSALAKYAGVDKSEINTKHMYFSRFRDRIKEIKEQVLSDTGLLHEKTH